MDDLLLFTPSKKVHMDKLEDLLIALRKNGLKISPKECQLIRTELQYMVSTIFIKERRVLEGYFLQNRIIFDSVDKLLPVSNMAYSCLKKCRLNNFIHFESVSEKVHL